MGNPGRSARLVALTITTILAALVAAGGAQAVRGSKFRPAVGTATGGVVATESIEASRVARDVLSRGGNAIDAAVAGAFAIGVARPQSCGIGGGGFLVYRSAGGQTDTLDFRETAPAAMQADTLAGPGPHKEFTGHRTVGVPGQVAGLAAALAEHGTISLADAVRPAAALAGGGVAVTRALAGDSATNAPRLRRFPESARLFLGPGGAPLEPGAVLRQPDLARTLLGIAEQGPRYFYSGPVARSIVASMATASEQLSGDIGLMTGADLAAYRATSRAALTGTYRRHGIVAMPPPTSGGVAVLEMLNLLEGFDLRGAGPSSPDALHLLAESQKLAFADRGAYVADPDVVPQPTERLVSKAYANERRGEIEPGRAKTYRPGNVGGASRREGADLNPRASTTHLSVIDGRGNAVALTCTIEQSFGSAVTAPGTGVLLNNELTDFSDPGTANQPGPNKAPRSSMAPTIVVRDGRPVLAVGGAGGVRIVEGVLLSIVGLIDFDRPADEALDAERLDASGTSLTLEEGRLPTAVRDELSRRGHRLALTGEYDTRPRLNAAGVRGERLEAVTDPRAETGALTSGRRVTGGRRTFRADAAAPTVRFTSARAVRDARDRRAVRLRWRARDRGTGVASSALQVRRRLPSGGYSPWSAVELDVRGTSLAVASPVRGRRVQFRVRVTDRSGNVSDFATRSHRFR